MDLIRAITTKPLSFQVLRYLFSGGTATLTNLGIFYVCTNVFDLPYLIASGLAFFAGFVLSFSLHKFVTFQNYDMAQVHVQAGFYLIFWGCNILLGVGLLYLFVEYAGLPPLLGQFLTVAIIAGESFFAYRYLVFREAVRHKDSAGSLEARTDQVS